LENNRYCQKNNFLLFAKCLKIFFLHLHLKFAKGAGRGRRKLQRAEGQPHREASAAMGKREGASAASKASAMAGQSNWGRRSPGWEDSPVDASSQ
jgi:hypothetical protein